MASTPYPMNTLSDGYRYKEIEIEIREGDRDRKKKENKKEILDRRFRQSPTASRLLCCGWAYERQAVTEGSSLISQVTAGKAGS